ncbi:hypothetical protein COF68_05425 [Bacillus toyonensis]|uniref:hypothetical protein n=1 Tax=Bacillus toyonensis TaxID=155322 RepID=UPI000BFD8CB9|nr:hypothetical protein [Bacillus toyonensis]PHE64283.1 hypothetical protein COF68_05425 [Bacillus toyonensis]
MLVRLEPFKRYRVKDTKNARFCSIKTGDINKEVIVGYISPYNSRIQLTTYTWIEVKRLVLHGEWLLEEGYN